MPASTVQNAIDRLQQILNPITTRRHRIIKRAVATGHQQAVTTEYSCRLYIADAVANKPGTVALDTWFLFRAPIQCKARLSALALMHRRIMRTEVGGIDTCAMEFELPGNLVLHCLKVVLRIISPANPRLIGNDDDPDPGIIEPPDSLPCSRQ
jgi:hypothetical protein